MLFFRREGQPSSFSGPVSQHRCSRMQTIHIYIYILRPLRGGAHPDMVCGVQCVVCGVCVVCGAPRLLLVAPAGAAEGTGTRLEELPGETFAFGLRRDTSGLCASGLCAWTDPLSPMLEIELGDTPRCPRHLPSHRQLAATAAVVPAVSHQGCMRDLRHVAEQVAPQHHPSRNWSPDVN